MCFQSAWHSSEASAEKTQVHKKSKFDATPDFSSEGVLKSAVVPEQPPTLPGLTSTRRGTRQVVADPEQEIPHNVPLDTYRAIRAAARDAA